MTVLTTLISIKILNVFPVSHSPMSCLVSYLEVQEGKSQFEMGKKG